MKGQILPLAKLISLGVLFAKRDTPYSASEKDRMVERSERSRKVKAWPVYTSGGQARARGVRV